MLLRARPAEGARQRFEPWFRDVHLKDVEKIPGISGVRTGLLPGGMHIGIYQFESAEALQVGLASPEAAYARGTWEQWAGELEELLLEMWAAVFPLPMYESPN
jgi:hypothetical protein